MHRYDTGNTAYNPDTYGPKSKPEVEWQFDLTAQSLENHLTHPVVADGMVFIASGRPDDTLYALNAVNGGTVWSYDDFSVLLGLADPLAYHDGRVYAVEGSLWSFDAGDGVDLWSKEIGGEGAHQGPKYADGKIFVYGGNAVHCFDEGGELLWENRHPNARPLAYSEGKLAVQSPETYASPEKYLAVLDAEDGSEVWSVELERSHPVAKEGVVYFSGEHLYAYDMHDGTEIWRNEATGDVRVLAEGEVYNQSAVIDAETGRTLLRLDEEEGLPRRWRGALADDVLYMWTGEEMYAYDTEEEKILWVMNPDFVWGGSQPVVADGRIYLVDGPELYCIAEEDT